VAPRIVLHTGKGGAGTTSVAAATARRAAAAGARTLLLATGPAHAPAAVLDADVGTEPTPVEGELWAAGVDPRAELARVWTTTPAPAVPPGLEEPLTLLGLSRHAESDEFDVLVVDLGTTEAALRALCLPDAARAWLDRLLPGQDLAAARPFARAVLDVATAPEDAVAPVLRRVLALADVLRAPERASIRLVATPDRVAVEETRRALTLLALHGFPVDAVLVNRVLPEESGDWFAKRRAQQAELLAEVTEAFAPVPVVRVALLAEEVHGPAMLDRLATAAFADRDPAAVLHTGDAERLELSEQAATLRLPLPFVGRDDVSLRQVGSDLVVRVRDHARTLPLPAALHGWSARGAALADGALTVELEAPVA
jgi:arsenite/tail-anchored protein-transporting ATPase